MAETPRIHLGFWQSKVTALDMIVQEPWYGWLHENDIAFSIDYGYGDFAVAPFLKFKTGDDAALFLLRFPEMRPTGLEEL